MEKFLLHVHRNFGIAHIFFASITLVLWAMFLSPFGANREGNPFSVLASKFSPQPNPVLAALMPVAPVYEDGCTDTDGGVQYFQQGKVTTANRQGRMVTYTDSCVAGSIRKLREYSCSSGVMQSQEYVCPAGCNLGACKRVGTVYVADTIDTEPSPTTPGGFSDTLDVADYQPGAFVDRILSSAFRNQFTDTFGGHPKISWFLLTTEGMCVSTQSDCTLIHSMMAPYGARLQQFGDSTGWHYHPANWNVNAEGKGSWDQQTTFNGTALYNGRTDVTQAEKLLSAVVIGQHTYPSTFRAGWTWENNDYSNWLDDILPYDFSNIAPLTSSPSGCDAAGCAAALEGTTGKGNIFDWSRAVVDWAPYHPASQDYQAPGSLKRWEFRSFMGWEEFEKAFRRAAAGQDTLITLYTHNYNQLELQQMYLQMVVDTAKNFPNVPFKFVHGLDGARFITDSTSDTAAPSVLVVRNTSGTSPSVLADDSQAAGSTTLSVMVNEPLFTFPYGALRVDGQYYRVMPVSKTPSVSNGLYTWTYDVTPYLTADQRNVFVAGGTDRAGNTFVSANVSL